MFIDSVVQEFVQNWSDHASVLGLLVSIIGFAITIIGVLRSKGAADRASEAAIDVRQKLSTRTALADLARVLTEVEEIRHLHRAGVWDALPMRYTALRRELLAIKQNQEGITRRQAAVIQGVIAQVATIEQIVEAAIVDKQPPPDIAALNRIAAEQGDKLSAMIISLQSRKG